MCLGIPMKIISMTENEAIAEVEDIKREISLDLIDNANVGDYVLVHAGFAIEKMDASTARESIRLRKNFGISTR
ncbi:HypC/HybG/HupF family hydrogenase formation chaperone [candidate division KSB1 bacterium]|nr:HypC/HybG/HupF family hydrogenase formation chaperone [candidate division KSB1 bacterium]